MSLRRQSLAGRGLASFRTNGVEPMASVVIAGELYKRNENVCRFFKAASRNERTEVSIWGAGWPAELASGVGRVEHQLSVAARAFKAHSMHAAGVQPLVEAAESFQSGAHLCSIAAPLRPRVPPARRC